MSVTGHVLDVVFGRPAAGLRARLEEPSCEGWRAVAHAESDDDGELDAWAGHRLEPGTYRVVFDTGSYFANLGLSAAYPGITVEFALIGDGETCRIQVMLAPFSYSVHVGARS